MTSVDFESDYFDNENQIDPTFEANNGLFSPTLRSAEVHKGFLAPEPFAAREQKKRSLLDSIISTAFFRCWHILILFTLWATIVTVLNANGTKCQLPSTLLTVVGTVLGFVTSTRASTSFQRYNQGKQFWYKLIYHSRVFARIVWFNVPEMAGEDGESTEESRARALIEKKTVLNLVLAHAVALKHYLRHEDGIYYKDLYYLVKYLPAYVEEQSIPSPSAQEGHIVFDDFTRQRDPPPFNAGRHEAAMEEGSSWHSDDPTIHYSPYNIPLPRSPLPPRSSLPPRSPSFAAPRTPKMSRRTRIMNRMGLHHRSKHGSGPAKAAILSRKDEAFLLPAKKPPKYHLLDLFPFSLLVGFLSQKYKDRQSKRARMKELLRRKRVNHNLPLELSMYIGSYITMIQKRKIADSLSINLMNQMLNQMVDAASNLEYIITTPLPFIYGIHMWLIALVYCFLLPLQIWKTMKWLTIPSTTLMTFVYFGFLVAGEELEDPFGYDKNDLDLDHFTNNIMRNELKTITSAPPPDPNRWIFVPENNVLFSTNLDVRTTPNEWANIGPEKIQKSLRMMR